MSVTTKIGCESCKVYLWIGQHEFIYTGEPETMKKLNEFLQSHKNYSERKHVLVFATDYYEDYWDGWTELIVP